MSTKVTSSTNSPDADFRLLLTAKPMSVTESPEGIDRNSGVRVIFPTKITLLKLAIIASKGKGVWCKG
jgi:hypothetical protein